MITEWLFLAAIVIGTTGGAVAVASVAISFAERKLHHKKEALLIAQCAKRDAEIKLLSAALLKQEDVI
jgi:hypothetical protein